MKRHLVFFYWLLLMVATLAIGGVTFYLLQREGERLRSVAEDNAARTGKTIQSNLNLLVNDVKNTSMDFLSKLPDGPSIVPQLIMWKDTTPYTFSVFYYPGPGRGLDWPLPNDPKRELVESMLRTPNGGWVWNDGQRPFGMYTRARNANSPNNYSQMIAGRQQIRQSAQNGAIPGVSGNAGTAPGADTLTSEVGEVAANLTTGNNLNVSQTTVISFSNGQAIDISNFLPKDFLQNLTGNNFEGRVIPANMAQQLQTILTKMGGDANGLAQSLASQQMITLVTTNRPPSHPEEDWIPVGPKEDPYWLGWMRQGPFTPVFGLLLDLAAMPLRNAFPEQLSSADGYILRNPAGKAVIARFGSGAMVQDGHGDEPVSDPAAKPAFAYTDKLPVGAEMPDWNLEVYFDPEAKYSTSFMAIGTILVTVLVVSVLLGGTLLMREARREAFEAARKTSFVSNVSHELKTPLTTIRMYAELLGEGRIRDPAKQRTYLTTIISESQRLTRLVNNVLDFSRLEQGRKQYHPDNVSLTEVVQSVLNAQHPRLEEAGFIVEADIAAAADLHVHTDRDALEQVMLNLIDNALKYAAEGRWLGVRISHDAEQAILSVSDHGPGVPADEQERIFAMFHRVDDSITARLPGAGLGLSIARRLLRDQEGDLHYVPNAPCGASFVASLPLAVPAEKNAVAPV